MRFVRDQALERRVVKITQDLDLDYILPTQISVFHSYGSKAHARARIWSFPKIWQLALSQKPHYCIEVLAEKFDHLSQDDQTRVLIHELLHIPKTFSGALRPHRHPGGRVDRATVEKLFRQLRT